MNRLFQTSVCLIMLVVCGLSAIADDSITGFTSTTEMTLNISPRIFKTDKVGTDSVSVGISINAGGYIGSGNGLVRVYRVTTGGQETHCPNWDMSYSVSTGQVIGTSTNEIGNCIPNAAGIYYYRAKFYCETSQGSGQFTEVQSQQVVVKVVNGEISSPSGGSKATFSPAATGNLTITCQGQIYPSEAVDGTLDAAVRWRMYNGDGIGGSLFQPSGTTRQWDTSNRDYGIGRTAIFTIDTLPANNSDFGRKTARYTLLDPDNLYREVFDMYNAPVKVFYTASAANNPIGIGPNWFYYYSQTSAYYGEASYDSTMMRAGFCDFAGGQWQTYIDSAGFSGPGRSAWGSPRYIDYFAWICRHEARHKDQFSFLWGANTNRNDNDDKDENRIGVLWVDYLPDSQEATLNRGYRPDRYATYLDDVGYGENPLRDCEDLCMRSSTTPYDPIVLWTNGSADNEDWAYPGKNY